MVARSAAALLTLNIEMNSEVQRGYSRSIRQGEAFLLMHDGLAGIASDIQAALAAK